MKKDFLIRILILAMAYITVCASAVVNVGCKVGTSSDNTNTENIDSNNINIGENSPSGRICIRCQSEDGLESLGYKVEDFLNCTDECGLEDGQDTPEKEQCDRDCIEERLEIASEVCLNDNDCEESNESDNQTTSNK